MKLRRVTSYFRLICVILCLTALSVAAAQEYHGQITFGGMPLPGATVTATQGDKKFVSVSDQDGVFTFPDLANGTWTIEVEMQGFSPVKDQVAIAPNAPPAPPWELKMLPLDQMNAQVQTQVKPVPTVITPSIPPAGNGPAKPSGKLPAGAANAPANKAATAPDKTAAASDKTTPPADKAPSTEDPLSQGATDGFLINGSQNNGAASPFAQLAAFGNNRPGGRSLYNGGIGVILDSSALDARPYSLSGFNTPRASYNRITTVATLGGPLKIPHLLKRGPNFFIGYQWTRNRNDTTQSALVPDAAERLGDFSNKLNALGQPLQIFDPATGLPFPGNMVPISPQAQALLNLYPLANIVGKPQYNYQIPIISNTHQDALQSRLDRGFGRKDQLSGGFSFSSARSSSPNLFGFLDATDVLGLNLNASWTHRFTQRLSLRLAYQYTRQSTNATPYWANRQNFSGDAGITGNNQDPVNWGPPSLNFVTVAGLSDGIFASNRNQTSAFSPSVSWFRTRHNLTFGGDFRRQEFNYLSQQNPRGTFTFTGAATQGGVPGAGSDLADFLLGVPDSSRIAFGNADKYFRQSVYDAYVNDDWRMRPGFTVSMGLRWEYGAPITEVQNRLVNLDITPGFVSSAPVVATNPVGPLTGQNYPNSLVRSDKRAFQPRLAIAWRPMSGSSLVVRAGYGISYDTSVYQAIAIQMAQQSPLSKSLSVQNSPACPLTLASGFNPCASVTQNTFAIDPNFRLGYAQNWYLTLQRELPGSLQLTATYQGTKGTRAPQEFLPNTFPAGAVNPCPTCPLGFAFLTSNGNSTREAGIVQLRRRLHNGFTGTLQYIFSKSIDDASALGGQGAAANGVIAQDWLNLNAERGLSSFDQRHVLSTQLQYTTGMGLRGGTLLSGWKGKAYKEWTLLTNITVGSGLPETPIYLAAVTGGGQTGTIRPDVTGVPITPVQAGFFLNPAAFTAPLPGQWGNAGRNSITGPSQFNLNASMSRTFRLHDRYNLDVRFDSNNLLNHVTFASWITTTNSTQFGLPAAPNSMRTMLATMRLRF